MLTPVNGSIVVPLLQLKRLQKKPPPRETPILRGLSVKSRTFCELKCTAEVHVKQKSGIVLIFPKTWADKLRLLYTFS